MASISYEEIRRASDILSKHQEDNAEEYKERFETINSNETKLLKKASGACSNKKVNSLLPDLNDVDEMILKRKIDSSFYNAETMNATACVIDATFYVPANTLGTLIRLKRWIRNLKKIGANSAQGVALKGDLGTAEGAFIIKAPKNDHHNNDIIHESVVSLYGTNKLRSHVPNFVYCYGAFSCASPIIAPDNHVPSWCIGSGKVTYMITENIYPSVSYKDYLMKASSEEFLCSYLQVLYALNEACKRIDFTHYDLHTENVLMREYTEDEYFQIPYNTERGLEYLVSNRIATIIDYGFSHIKYQGEDYGIDLAKYSVYATRSHIMHDAYKLLLMAAYDLKDTDSPILEDIKKIYTFFSDDDLMEILEEHFELDRFAIPIIDQTIFDLTAFIRDNFECNFISDSPGKFKTLKCTLDNKCPNVNSAFSDIGLSTKEYKQARDFFEYYEAKRSTKEKVSIDYEAARTNFENMLVENYNDIMNSVETIEKMPREGIEEYMSFLYALVEALDNYNTLLLEIYIGNRVMKEFNEKPDFSEFHSIDDQLSDLIKIVIDTEAVMENTEYEQDHKQVADRIIEIYNSLHSRK